MDESASTRLHRRTTLGLLAGGLAGGVAGCAEGTTGSERAPVPAAFEDASIRAPPEVLVEDELAIQIDGLPSDGQVEVETRIDDGPFEWTATATFEVPESGTVDLTEQAPIEGMYTGDDPMGLVLAMEATAPPEDAFFTLAGVDHDLEVSVRPADAGRTGLAAETTVRRVAIADGVDGTAVGDGLVGTLYTPPGADEAPGVVALHGSGGEELGHQAQHLASNGFVVLDLHYFGDPEPIPDMFNEIPVEYVEDAVGKLLAHDRVVGDTVGLYGVSKGGELALLAGSVIESVGPVVSIVGSGLVWGGLDDSEQQLPTGSAAFTLDGDPVSYVPYGEPEPPWTNTKATYMNGYESASDEQIAAATIPVEDIDGPVLLVSAGDDGFYDGPFFHGIAEQRRLDHDRQVEHLVYEAAGHLIDVPFTPTYGRSIVDGFEFGGDPTAYARADREHWPAVLDTLGGAGNTGGN